MKHIAMLAVLSFLLLTKTNAQRYKQGQKAEGGIVFPHNNKSGLVIAEKGLGFMSWEEGKRACEALVLNGYDDWRLPTMKELAIIYYQFYIKRIDEFPTGYYWSKSENKGIRELAWCFDFKDGQEYNSHSKANSNYILPVRTY